MKPRSRHLDEGPCQNLNTISNLSCGESRRGPGADVGGASPFSPGVDPSRLLCQGVAARTCEAKRGAGRGRRGMDERACVCGAGRGGGGGAERSGAEARWGAPLRLT